MSSRPIGRDLVRIAVLRQASAIHTELLNHPTAAPVEFHLNVTGLPGYTRANLLAARRVNGSVRVHVCGLDDVPIEANDPLMIDLDASPTPPASSKPAPKVVTGKNGTQWTPAPGGLQPEVVEIDDAGEPVQRQVDTDRYKLQMTCRCGRTRFAMRSSIHQVDSCRPCATLRRHNYQVSWQRNRRRAARTTT